MKNLTNIPKNFTLILYKEGTNRKQKLERLETKSRIKFGRKLKLIPNQFDAYLRVSYSGKGWNDGYYQNIADLLLAFSAFMEK